jgi:hypothetical protein
MRGGGLFLAPPRWTILPTRSGHARSTCTVCCELTPALHLEGMSTSSAMFRGASGGACTAANVQTDVYGHKDKAQRCVRGVLRSQKMPAIVVKTDSTC